ncbi:Mpo1-like protein [Fimbriiglobus ruber]|uniref:Mpo1-like protein n=1 Tax=Fimbriiglobus ruber TaxID=1908690 RepID=UPI00137B0337|nr:Mpo1-like protein [Fimbriiglobus ruber]
MPENPQRYSFPIARRVARVSRAALANWRERHQNAFNFWIHLIGIPLALAGLGLLFFADWYWGVGAFVLGYFLQWVGHLVEGNDVGELIPIKRALGLPVVAVIPRPTPPPAPALPN